jgi:predicted HAD superfamily Cof-like phosphohydrolase
VNLLDGTTEFMKLAEQNIAGGQFDDPDIRQLRVNLLNEEAQEYWRGEKRNDLVEVVDGLLDVIVIAWGTLLAYVGVEKAERAAAEVVRSNLDKVKDGVVRREDGKILKPAGWRGPDIAGAIE